MFTNSNEELENFKRRVDLVQLARSYGYTLVRKESCRTSVVMKNEANASKIIVATAQDGHGIFFEVHGDISGSVIDFVMYREGCSLGQARKVLREWLGMPHPVSTQEYVKPRPAANNRTALASIWHRMGNYDGNYLKSRGLSDDTIRDFSHHIKMDARGNVCFRHDDENGLSGWETKNRGFTGFSGGGNKALFICNTFPPGEEPTRIIITEAAIDAMSYAQLSEKPGLFVSFSGNLSPDQYSQLANLLRKYSKAHVIVATDADAQGEKYAVFINSLCQDRPSELFHRERPRLKSRRGEHFKDWNDVLMERPTPPKLREMTSQPQPHRDIDQKPLRTPSYHPGRPDHFSAR